MSLDGDRQELADALNTVEGVSAYPFRPRTLPPGTAWPLLGFLDRGEAADFLATWQVWIVLDASPETASAWFDGHYVDIADAVAGFGYVTRIEPGLVKTGTGEINAMMITIQREA